MTQVESGGNCMNTTSETQGNTSEKEKGNMHTGIAHEESRTVSSEKSGENINQEYD